MHAVRVARITSSKIGLGLLQYTQDYDERFPLSVVSPISPPAAGDPAVAGFNDRFQPVCNNGPGKATNLAGGGIRHFDGANYGFADGHAKWATIDKMDQSIERVIGRLKATGQ